MLRNGFKSFLILFLIFGYFNISFATSGGVDANGCHNSVEGYHCHTPGTDTSSGKTIDSTSIYSTILSKTGITYNNIIKKLKERRSCGTIFSESERKYCFDILKEGDIYTKEEVILKLKEKKNCDFFYSLYSDKSECEYYMKTENIYTIEEIKKETYIFSRCDKLIKFKMDYEVCKSEHENKIKNDEKEKKLKEMQLKIEDKFETIRQKIDVVYVKSPRTIQKFQIQIFDVLPKLKEGTMNYMIVKKLDEYLRILTWVDYNIEEN